MKLCGILLAIKRILKSKNAAYICVTSLIVCGLLLNFHAVTYEYIPDDEIIYHIVTSTEPSIDSCPVLPNLSRRMQIVVPETDYNESSYALNLNVRSGGNWQPDDCKYVHDVAVIIPYRNRAEQLKAFLHHIHPFLQKQLLKYSIFVVEQTVDKPFNRGKLFNIGFLEALKIHPFHCVIFHDVDLLPLVDSNIYACTSKPRHLSASIDSWRFNLKYEGAFGGVSAMLRNHFLTCNGYSNSFFGWGGEDDDLRDRILAKNLSYCRFSPELSRYHMIPHKQEQKNPERLNLLRIGAVKRDTDGLNSVQYKVLKFEKRPLYNYFLVEL